jgi:Xaa-Pro aminopeptidase
MYLNDGVNSDSELKTMLPDEKYTTGKAIDRETLYEVMAESRVIKNNEEILALRWASQITAEAHVRVFNTAREGMRESQVDSHFNFYGQQNYLTGRVAPYLPICGCGHTAATLHYNVNNQYLKNGQTMLTDQGHSFHHYISDVTTVFPVNGKFT